ncbi:type II toxin-antitoxin system prevent-host-death family antitoxin [Necropsobacter massiliensis]|uniref:type II toxin-antitoxin system prevent-host-death family antitoxin n=1 Tax=Necropsobacter massiliensis TaxID=1400001 RepID=UPI000595F844|nr:type II toxin-antitoxin system prevent-host-death family antitoxin [Necropsobacter massiliensis]
MTIMTSREFNQNTGLAQKHAQNAPVIITNRGKPAFVLMKFEEYLQRKPAQSTLEALMSLEHPDVADIDLPLQPRSKAQRPEIDWGEI